MGIEWRERGTGKRDALISSLFPTISQRRWWGCFFLFFSRALLLADGREISILNAPRTILLLLFFSFFLYYFPALSSRYIWLQIGFLLWLSIHVGFFFLSLFFSSTQLSRPPFNNTHHHISLNSPSRYFSVSLVFSFLDYCLNYPKNTFFLPFFPYYIHHGLSQFTCHFFIPCTGYRISILQVGRKDGRKPDVVKRRQRGKTSTRSICPLQSV